MTGKGELWGAGRGGPVWGETVEVSDRVIGQSG